MGVNIIACHASHLTWWAKGPILAFCLIAMIACVGLMVVILREQRRA